MSVKPQNIGHTPTDGGSGLAFEDQTLSDFLRKAGAFLRRHSRLILGGAAIGAVLAVVLTVQLEDSYDSELLLRVEQPGRSPIEAEPAPGAAAGGAFVDGQVYIIESTEILRNAVAGAGLTDEPYFQRQPKGWIGQQIDRLKALVAPAEPAEPGVVSLDDMTPAEAYAVRTLRSNLDVYRRGDTELISIKVTADTARLAARTANAVGAAYQSNRETARLDQALQVAGWLDERALELQRKLAEAEDAVAAFQIENGLISGEPGTTLSEQQLSELNTELIATRAELAQRRAAYSRFQEVVQSGGDVQSLPEVQASGLVQDLRARLLEIERREVELGGADASHPRLTSLREERTTIEAQLAVEVERIGDGIANEVGTLEARERLVVEALDEAGGATGMASRSSVELRELQRRADAYRALYERYLSNSGLVDEGITYLRSGIEIVDPATAPENPVAPPLKVFLLFGLLFGGTLGALVAVVREAMLPGFMSGGQVSRVTGLPVLACVPEFAAKENAQDLTRDDPMSPYSEAIRTLRYEIGTEPRGADQDAPVFVVTSSRPGEGKTTLAAALATSAAAGGQNVLLIDADLRQGSLSKLLIPDDPDGVGLSDVLRSTAWNVPDLMPGEGEIDLMPRGGGVSNPTDLLAGKRMQAYLDAARRAYDIVIIDGPPVANMADAPLLARLADMVAFVVRWNDTPRDAVSEAIHRLNPSRAKIGIALNAVDLRQAAEYGETYGQYAPTPVRMGPTHRRVFA